MSIEEVAMHIFVRSLDRLRPTTAADGEIAKGLAEKALEWAKIGFEVIDPNKSDLTTPEAKSEGAGPESA